MVAESVLIYIYTRKLKSFLRTFSEFRATEVKMLSGIRKPILSYYNENILTSESSPLRFLSLTASVACGNC